MIGFFFGTIIYTDRLNDGSGNDTMYPIPGAGKREREGGCQIVGGVSGSYQDLFSSVVAFLEPLDAEVAVEVEVPVVAVAVAVVLVVSLVLVLPPDLQ